MKYRNWTLFLSFLAMCYIFYQRFTSSVMERPIEIQSSDPNAKIHSKYMKILCFGDSLTHGYYGHGAGEHAYSLKLLELISLDFSEFTFEIKTSGVPGETTLQMLARLPLELNSDTFSVVVILGGTNDLPYGDVDNIFSNVQKLHSMVHDSSSISTLVTIPPLKQSPKFLAERRLMLNKKLREYAKQNIEKIVLADLALSPELNPEIMSKDEQDKVFDDNIHFTPEGYDRMGAFIYNAIKPQIQLLVNKYLK